MRYAATTGTGDVAGYPGDEATKRYGGRAAKHTPLPSDLGAASAPAPPLTRLCHVAVPSYQRGGALGGVLQPGELHARRRAANSTKTLTPVSLSTSWCPAPALSRPCWSWPQPWETGAPAWCLQPACLPPTSPSGGLCPPRPAGRSSALRRPSSLSRPGSPSSAPPSHKARRRRKTTCRLPPKPQRPKSQPLPPPAPRLLPARLLLLLVLAVRLLQLCRAASARTRQEGALRLGWWTR